MGTTDCKRIWIVVFLLCLALVLVPSVAGAQQLEVRVSFGFAITMVVGGVTIFIIFGTLRGSGTAQNQGDNLLADLQGLPDEPLNRGLLPVLKW